MEQFKYNELTFQLMVEASPTALILVNNTGKIAYINNFAENLFQYSKIELIGHELDALIPNSYLKGHSHLMQTFYANPISRPMGRNRETFAIKKDGTEFPVEIGLNPIVTTNGVMVLAAIIDITERRKTENQFRLVIEAMPNAIVLVNASGEITMINKQTELQFGYSQHELLGNKMEMLLPDKYRQGHPQKRDDFFKNPRVFKLGAGRDLHAVRKDGTEFPVEIGLNPIETAEGTLVLTSIINITERKQYQNLINENIINLYNKNKDLEQSEQNLKESNATKDRLFAIIGHDLRGPIGGFKQLIDFLISDFDLNDTDSLSELLKTVQKTATITYDLLENLLLWAKSQQHAVSFSPITCDLNEITSNNILLLREVASQKGITINNEIPGSQLVIADSNMLATVIRNLISNAIKFTPTNKNIFVSVTNEENNWIISVRDEGIGISTENINKIFNPTLNFTTFGTNNEKGSGLGLKLCQEFVQKHNGKIWIESEPGSGSNFKFTLPMSN